MKYILTTILVLTSLGFYQTIVPIEQRKNTDETNGTVYYFKDVNGVFDKFLGNWKYQDQPTNPTKVVEITFYKREMVKTGFSGFKDEIFARIKYTENGVVIYDTFPALQPSLNRRDHNISGGSFSEPNNTNLLNIGYYSEPGLGGETGRLKLEYSNLNNVEKLEWEIITFREENGETPFRLPYGMTLIKQ